MGAIRRWKKVVLEKGDQDNCSFDAYSNLIHTISVGAIGSDDLHASYSEACTALMVSAYSNQDYKSTIFTTSSKDGECNGRFGGTSAATPQVAGVIALGLEARPDLTWRDVQNVLIQSAVPIQLEHASWETTYSGRAYSTLYGYGKVDAYNFVKVAKEFTLVGPQTAYISPVKEVSQTIPYGIHGISSSIHISEDDLKEVKLKNLEHVTVTVKIQHSRVTDLFVDLVSPNGIRSPLVVSREK
ncbi:pheromone processing endoprotease [Massospora cicadina]|nr:pheromone processing endoprotease [Massospora cicadina]